MILGIDASTLHCGNKVTYSANKQVIDPLVVLNKDNGVDYLRLRLWVDPFDEKGESYGAGGCDLPRFIALAKEGISKGYRILLDFHYSDFWCDPEKQFIPKKWKNMDLETMCQAIYAYTKDTLIAIKKAGIALSSIQIGNEITNGMLWPIGAIDHQKEGHKRYENLAKILFFASKAVKEETDAKIVIHLERSYDLKGHQEYFEALEFFKIPYDVIGLSYYPYWHKEFSYLFANIDNLKEKFHKPVWIVETSYAFTLEAFKANDGKTYFPILQETSFKDSNVLSPYPFTEEGQEEYLKELLRLSLLHEVEAIFYWEPFWIPKMDVGWSTLAGVRYLGQEGKSLQNEWANQCLFNYEGEATKGFFAYKKPE